MNLKHFIISSQNTAKNYRMGKHIMKEYITEINTLLPYADIDLLDLILQILQKSVEKSDNITPSEEHPQLI